MTIKRKVPVPKSNSVFHQLPLTYRLNVSIIALSLIFVVINCFLYTLLIMSSGDDPPAALEGERKKITDLVQCVWQRGNNRFTKRFKRK